MKNCCSKQNCSATKGCPQCGKISKSVELQTVVHQVKFPDVLSIVEDDYYFCDEQSCALVYFSASNKQIYKQQISVFDSARAAKLCYCFDVDKEVYIQALANNSAAEIKQFVVQKTQASLCACEIKNPSGRCCLADFKKLEAISRVKF